MKLVLLRHAQKGITPFDDPHLTDSGFLQSEALADLVQKNILPAPTHLWASPKIRTTQTLSATAEIFKISIQKNELLDLRSAHETAEHFRKRIQELLSHLDERSISHSHEVHYLCTHYDWIEEAITLINADKDLNSFEFSHWSPTQYIVFEVQELLWRVLIKGNANVTKSY